MANYYNEFDAYAAEWIRNLIKAGHVPDGEVDTRSIVDVAPDDLRGFTQCHFFAGILGWPLAIRISGYSETESIWTGSCPCQPFSVAGKGKGVDDERHLWPHFFRLIRACKPKVVMGEQVAGKAGYGWFDGVRSDLEAEGYACDGVDIPACAVNAPHIRQRLYWVAHTSDIGTGRVVGQASDGGRQAMDAGAKSLRRADRARSTGGTDARDTVDVANANGPERRSAAEGRRDVYDGTDAGREEASGGREFRGATDGGDVADADDARREGRTILPECADEQSAWSRGVEWRRGADGKTRRVKSGVLLLVDGLSGGVAFVRTAEDGTEEKNIYSRVGALKGFGNAIVPSLAAEVIKAFMETRHG